MEQEEVEMLPDVCRKETIFGITCDRCGTTLKGDNPKELCRLLYSYGWRVHSLTGSDGYVLNDVLQCPECIRA